MTAFLQALSYTEIIHDTESQSLENIENPFSNTHTRREQPTASTASTSNNTRETVHIKSIIIDKFYVSQNYFINFINCKNVRFVEVMKC